MQGLPDRVAAHMTRHVLVEPGDCILAGVSGGMDSVCLLSVLRGLAPKGGFRLIVAHLNHGLRGPDADADAEFVAGLAREWDLPCVVERVDVPALARDRRLSLEEAARHARYAFLARAAGERGARFVAVAHHQDDQAETVLMHFLRGSGPAGLRGMLPLMSLTDYWSEPGGSEFDAAPLLLRPLLSVPRAEIAAYCREHGLAWRTDASNADMRHYRNRLRHELLPVLAGYNPRINEVLARTAEVMAGDYEVLETLAEEEFAELAILTVPDVVAFEQERLLLLPPGLQRALIRMSVRHLRSHLRDVNWEHVERALETVRVGAHGDAATIAGGLELRIDRGLAQIGPEGALPRSMLAPLRPRLSAAVVVPAPGALPLADGWRVEVDALGRADLPADWEYNADPWTAYLDAEAAGAALTLRPRLPGDRFRPLGLGGHTVRVNEFMINEHLPATERPDWPLLVGACGILWVCGYRVDDAAAVKPSTQHIWRVRFRR